MLAWTRQRCMKGGIFVQVLTPAEATAAALTNLGLPAPGTYASPVAMAESLRRAASLICPCAPRTLVLAVADAAKGLVSSVDEYARTASEILEALVAHGDLLETREVMTEDAPAKTARLVYLAPPSFVLRESGSAVLIGLVPDEVYPLPDDLRRRITHNRHVRTLVPETGEDLRELLAGLSLRELRMDEWICRPRNERPEDHLSRANGVFDNRAGYVALDNLEILDPSRHSGYYRGRWRALQKDSGRFIARRPQSFGADRWCYIEAVDGVPARMMDLPWDDARARGCDEAWRLQVAIDATLGRPQQFRVVPGEAEGYSVLQFFSPVPGWARRQWDAVGLPLEPQRCLFAYSFEDREVGQEIAFARDQLWLREAS